MSSGTAVRIYEKGRNERANALIEILREDLIHGSGIDCEWTFKINNKSRYVFAYNSYHVMNENGIYDGYADFKLKISVENPVSFKLTFSGRQGGELNKKHMLRDYLEETFYWNLEEITKKWQKQ